MFLGRRAKQSICFLKGWEQEETGHRAECSGRSSDVRLVQGWGWAVGSGGEAEGSFPTGPHWQHLLLIPVLHRPGRRHDTSCFNLKALHTHRFLLPRGPVGWTHRIGHTGLVLLQPQGDIHTHAIKHGALQSQKHPAHVSSASLPRKAEGTE